MTVHQCMYLCILIFLACSPVRFRSVTPPHLRRVQGLYSRVYETMIPGICISSVDSLMNGSLIPFEEYMPLNLGERFSLCEGL
jgi:hypothetical protein